MNQFEFFFRIKSYRAAYSSSQTSSYLTVWQGRKLSKDYNQRNKIKKAARSFTFFLLLLTQLKKSEKYS
jgi:hypothetical protein